VLEISTLCKQRSELLLFMLGQFQDSWPVAASYCPIFESALNNEVRLLLDKSGSATLNCDHPEGATDPDNSHTDQVRPGNHDLLGTSVNETSIIYNPGAVDPTSFLPYGNLFDDLLVNHLTGVDGHMPVF
jgi:hypothetical protein